MYAPLGNKADTFWFEDLNLTIGRMEKFGDVITVRISVNLNPEGNSFLSSMLLRREFGGKAIDWREKEMGLQCNISNRNPKGTNG